MAAPASPVADARAEIPASTEGLAVADGVDATTGVGRRLLPATRVAIIKETASKKKFFLDIIFMTSQCRVSRKTNLDKTRGDGRSSAGHQQRVFAQAAIDAPDGTKLNLSCSNFHYISKVLICYVIRIKNS
jgi:hypothetical protein